MSTRKTIVAIPQRLWGQADVSLLAAKHGAEVVGPTIRDGARICYALVDRPAGQPQSEHLAKCQALREALRVAVVL